MRLSNHHFSGKCSFQELPNYIYLSINRTVKAQMQTIRTSSFFLSFFTIYLDSLGHFLTLFFDTISAARSLSQTSVILVTASSLNNPE